MLYYDKLETHSFYCKAKEQFRTLGRVRTARETIMRSYELLNIMARGRRIT